MLLPLVLNALALAALLVALGAFAAMKLKYSKRRQTAAIGLLVATVCVLGATFFNAAAYVQDRADIDLGLPAEFPTKVKLWLQQREEAPPDPKEVARNIQIIRDGLVFYKAHENRFPPEAKLQMEELQGIPLKITHVLSYAEEQRYYRAAQAVITIFRAIAVETTPSPAPKAAK